MEGYQIRLPKDYDSVPYRALPSGQKAFVWMGPSGRDDYSLVRHAAARERARITLSEFLDKSLAEGSRGPDWQRTPAESGQMGGLDFLRAGWQCTVDEIKRKIHGLTYVAKEADKLIAIQATGIEPINEDAFRLATAALTTFRKKAAGEPAAAPPAESVADLPVWEPYPKFLDQLDPYQDVGDYQIRLPKGYEKSSRQIPQPNPTGMKMYQWALRRADESVAAITVFIETSPMPQLYARSAENQIADLSEAGQGDSDWQQKPIRVGHIQWHNLCEKEFAVRGKWKDKKTFQFCYVSKDSGTLITILARDEEPHNQESLKLLNAAVLTFRKK